MLSIHPSSHPALAASAASAPLASSAAATAAAAAPAAGSSRLLPGSASSFSSGSSSWNWEGEGDHHLPTCCGPSARHREKGRKGREFHKRCIRRAEERQHPGLQESREEKKRTRVRGQRQHTDWTCCCIFPFDFSLNFSSGGKFLKIFLTLSVLCLTGGGFYLYISPIFFSSHNLLYLSSLCSLRVSSLRALSTITIFIIHETFR